MKNNAEFVSLLFQLFLYTIYRYNRKIIGSRFADDRIYLFSIYWYIVVCTSMKRSYWWIPVYTVLFQYSCFHPGGRDSRPSISYTISTYDIEVFFFSISKSWNLDIGDPVIDVRYRRWVTFDIKQWDLRYRTPLISITISQVQNVDIEWAYDIEVFDI